MHVGVPKEIKNHEYRVGLTPPSVAELTHHGHAVTVETGAGSGIDFTDDDYRAAGAAIAPSAHAVFEAADMIVKVKEPQLQECAWLRQGQKIQAIKAYRERTGVGLKEANDAVAALEAMMRNGQL